MPLHGVDVSRWQGRVDWARVAREGFAFATARATKGAGELDPEWARNRDGMRAAGLVCGGYHVLTRDDPADQVGHFLRALGEPEGQLIQVDVEPYTVPGSTARVEPRWADLVEFMRLLRLRVSTHPVLLYSGRWFWRDRAWPTRDPNGAALGALLWDSRYVPASVPTGPASVMHATIGDPVAWRRRGYGGWSEATVMQFTDRAAVAGKRMDADAFYGTPDQLLELAVARRPAPGVAAVAASLHRQLGPLISSAYGDERSWWAVAEGVQDDVREGQR